MYLRIVRGKPQPGHVDEVITLWQDILAPRLKAEPGFLHAYFIGNRDTDTVIGVQVWERLPDPAIMSQFRERMRGISTGPPDIEDYEVFSEAQPEAGQPH